MMDDFVVKTSANEKDNLDEQLSRFIFSANCPFKLVENKEFKKFCTTLRPGYTPPSRTDVSDKWLPKIYNDEIMKCKSELENKTVCMSMDGWSNIRNEPIVCVNVIKECGKDILVDAIDTSGSSHTGNYLANLVFNSIKSTEENFKCKVTSFVTDNTGNMASAREILNGEFGFEGLTYGCSAHILNLLAKDLVKTDITKHVTNILKYFRNHHLPKAWYHAEGGSALILPLEVRWNTYCDSLESYIKNWSILTKVCEDHRSEIDRDIANKILNIGLKRNVEDMIKNLKPVAEAIDNMQKNNCSLAECVFTWKKLELKLNEASNNKDILSLYKARYEQAMTDAHFASFILSPSMLTFNSNQKKEEEKIDITKEEKKKGLEFIKEKCGSGFVAVILKFLGKLEPFHNHDKSIFFDPTVVETMSDYEWWNSFSKILNNDLIGEKEIQFINMMTTAKASTASIERIFSKFGLVHTKLRNRLGVEKASKLVFLIKQMNSNS